MAGTKPPDWEDDRLSLFFSQTEFNERVIALNLPRVYNVLKKVNALFLKIEEAVEIDNSENLFVPRLLMIRAHAAVLASMRLSMSGQSAESYPILRSAVELTWYALHIAKDPSSPSRTLIWLKRDEGKAEKARCKSEFTIANVRRTYEHLDAAVAKSSHENYEALIDSGAHPNQFGVMANMIKTESGERTTFAVGILNPDKMVVLFSLRMAVAVSIDAYKTFDLIFPEKFQRLGIGQLINEIAIEASQAFKP